MNYFEWFDLPCSLKIDKPALKRKFYEKSRLLHPDFHANAPTQEQLAILEQASLNNAAYKTLSDKESLLKYLLELKEKLAPEGENKVPEEFLFEMMDLNEMVMELQMDLQLEMVSTIETAIHEKGADLENTVAPLMNADSVDDFTKSDWALLVDYYLKRRYLYRLKHNFAKAIEQA